MEREFSSFRDPSGHLFWDKGRLFRAVTDEYYSTYRTVKETGLYQSLISDHKIISFREHSTGSFPQLDKNIKTILESNVLPFISYPYEWSFSQLKDAALHTLDLHIFALKNSFILKDASAFNIQFYEGSPIFIDHLSFDKIEKYQAWPAYGQFCRHFLAPLLLMSRVDPTLNVLLKHYLDGIPLQVAKNLLPTSKLLSFGLLLHFLIHERSQRKYSKIGLSNIVKSNTLSSKQLLNFAHSLRNTVSKILWKPDQTEWSAYYNDTNYSDTAMSHKIEIIKDFTNKLPNLRTAWDFGGNIGQFSRSICNHVQNIVCFDIDISAVEKNYLLVKRNREKNILPLVMDFTNPSPGLGFSSQERLSLNSRGKADLGIVLALIHHLAISNNIPLDRLAQYFHTVCEYLILEFVPKEDSQTRKLLSSREDVFKNYNIDEMKRCFSIYFETLNVQKIKDSERTIFSFKAL